MERELTLMAVRISPVEKNAPLAGAMLEVFPALSMASIAAFNKERVVSRDSLAMVLVARKQCGVAAVGKDPNSRRD